VEENEVTSVTIITEEKKVVPTETGCVEVGISAGNCVNLETKTEGIVSSLPGKKRNIAWRV
jgi:hypothetical protein